MTRTTYSTESRKKLLLRGLASLFAVIVLVISFFALRSYAENEGAVTTAPETSANAPDASGAETTNAAGTLTDDEPIYTGDNTEASLLQQVIGVDASQPIEIILLLTLLALVPSILIMMTCFTRIIIVFGFLRTAMQTQNTPPNMVLTGLALFLTIFIMAPVFSQINDAAYKPYVDGELTTEEAVVAATVPMKEFMLKQTSNDDLNFFIELGKIEEPEGGFTEEYIKNDLGLHVIIPSFIISELKRAFQMGFLIFIPFLIIDLVVGSTLMSMGMMMLPPAMISMPFKLMIFVLADGWNLLIGTLISSYNL